MGSDRQKRHMSEGSSDSQAQTQNDHHRPRLSASVSEASGGLQQFRQQQHLLQPPPPCHAESWHVFSNGEMSEGSSDSQAQTQNEHHRPRFSASVSEGQANGGLQQFRQQQHLLQPPPPCHTESWHVFSNGENLPPNSQAKTQNSGEQLPALLQ